MRPPLTAVTLVAALLLPACAGDLGTDSSKSRVYHPVASDEAGGGEGAALPPEARGELPPVPQAPPATAAGSGVAAGAPAAPAPPAAETPHLLPGALAAGTSDADPYFKDLLGREAPELPREGTWITPAPAPSLAGLRGQPVYLQFAFLGCAACALTLPTLSHWHDAYGPRGLVVVYVDNGLTDKLPASREGIASRGIGYPVFHDTEGKAILAYGIRAFPTGYLIGKDGRVLWEGNPLGIEAKVEEEIVKALP